MFVGRFHQEHRIKRFLNLKVSLHFLRSREKVESRFHLVLFNSDTQDATPITDNAATPTCSQQNREPSHLEATSLHVNRILEHEGSGIPGMQMFSRSQPCGWVLKTRNTTSYDVVDVSLSVCCAWPRASPQFIGPRQVPYHMDNTTIAHPRHYSSLSTLRSSPHL